MSARKDPAVFCTPRSKCFTSCPVLLLPLTVPSPLLLRIFLFRFPVHLFVPLFLITCFCFLSCLLLRGCEMGGTEFELQYGRGIFPFYKSPDRFWGQPSLSLLVSGVLDILFRGVNRLGREGNNSSSFSAAEVKNNWSCNSAPPVCLHVFRPLLFYLLRSFLSWFSSLSSSTSFFPFRPFSFQRRSK